MTLCIECILQIDFTPKDGRTIEQHRDEIIYATKRTNPLQEKAQSRQDKGYYKQVVFSFSCCVFINSIIFGLFS